MAEYTPYWLGKPVEWIKKVIEGAVIFTEPMNLTEPQKAQFRDNIGAASTDNSWQPKGYFDTYEELAATITNPAPGDAYGVGLEPPYDIWVWDGLRGRWLNNGPIKGMDGKDGVDGSDANVTAENIITALGYTPADADNLQPVAIAANLLDNSNFEQFIAQAGTGGKHGTQAYAGDRWILESGTVTGTANENGNGYSAITLNGTIVQVVANPPAVGTPVLGMVSGTASISYADGEVTITSAGGAIKNVALYEGEYAAGAEPKYQPKGYGAELVECSRYYVPHQHDWDQATNISGSGFFARLVCPVQMRVAPTAVVSGLQVYLDGWKDTTATGVRHRGAGMYDINLSTTGLALGQGLSYLVKGIKALSADLPRRA